MEFTPESLARSKDLYEKALKLDPQFALAQVGRAAYFRRGSQLPAAREAMPLAREAARKALAIDPSLPDALAVLGVIAAVYDYDWIEAEHQFQWAMVSDPVPPMVRHWYAFFFLGLIVGPRKRSCRTSAHSSRTLSTWHSGSHSQCPSVRRANWDDAELELRQILEIDQNFSLALMLLSIDRWTRGMLAEAIALAEKAYHLAPANPQIVAFGLVTHTGEADQRSIPSAAGFW